MSEALVHVAERAVTWSETADRLKHRRDLVRWIVFALSIAGALAAAIASQLSSGGSTTSIHSVFAAIGTVFLAASAFVSSRFLRDDDLRAWVRARGAAEALKREAFKCAVRSKPYGDAVCADQSLIAEREKVENTVEDLADRAVIRARPGSSPRDLLTKQQYREQRIENQINAFYRPKADGYRKIASRLRAIESTLALTATIITSLAGVVGKSIQIGAERFDLAALTAVLTTVSGAILGPYRGLALPAPCDELSSHCRTFGGRRRGFCSTCGRSEFLVRLRQSVRGHHPTENTSWLAKWTH